MTQQAQQSADNSRRAKHSSESVEHLTPAYVVEPARAVVGGFDLDPATTPFANEIVGAQYIYTAADDGLHAPDGSLREWRGRVFLNPPGGTLSEQERGTRSKQLRWWIHLCDEYVADRTTSAFFVGFNLEILQTSQQAGAPCLLDFPHCIPRARIPFDVEVTSALAQLAEAHAAECAHTVIDMKKVSRIEKKVEQLEPFVGGRVSGKQPAHANILVLLPETPEQVELFQQHFAPLGYVGLGRWR